MAEQSRRRVGAGQELEQGGGLQVFFPILPRFFAKKSTYFPRKGYPKIGGKVSKGSKRQVIKNTLYIHLSYPDYPSQWRKLCCRIMSSQISPSSSQSIPIREG